MATKAPKIVVQEQTPGQPRLKSTVGDRSKAVDKMEPALTMVRALMGGTDAMRGAGKKYLPAWPNEEPDAHSQRVKTSTLFPAYSRTVTTLAGKPFSKPLTYGKKVPANIKEMLEEDCDLQGRNLDTFASCVLESALAYGMSGILVDYPRVEAGQILTVADEAAAGLRPYFIEIMPWNILGWRSDRINGVETLTQLRLMESVSEDAGDFGEAMVAQVRVLGRGTWATYRKDEKLDDWVLHQEGVTTIDFIPFVAVYGHRTGFMTSAPPMLEMAHLNIKHWQSQSDQDNILHVSRVPILYVAGVEDDNFKMTVGASAAIRLPMGATAGFIEHTGAAMGAGRVALEDLKEEMRQAGAELLVLQPGAVTATQVGSESSIGMCALQRIVGGTEDALDLALQYFGRWIKVDETGDIDLFKDFAVGTLAEASTQILVGMQQSGVLSKKTLLNEAKRRGILSSEVDVDAEIEAAAADGPPLGAMGGGAGGAGGAA